jgi:hypothetical protein
MNPIDLLLIHEQASAVGSVSRSVCDGVVKVWSDSRTFAASSHAEDGQEARDGQRDWVAQGKPRAFAERGLIRSSSRL